MGISSRQTCTPTTALLRQLLLPHQLLLPMRHDFILLNLRCYNTATTENLLPLLSPSFYISTSPTDHPASRHATRRFGNSHPGTWIFQQFTCQDNYGRHCRNTGKGTTIYSFHLIDMMFGSLPRCRDTETGI